MLFACNISLWRTGLTGKNGEEEIRGRMKTRRNLFIALPLPEEIQKSLQELKGFFPGRKFAGNPHITLYFIGSGHACEDFIPALEAVKGEAFELGLSRLGMFGDRTLWAGLEPCPALHDLQRSIGEAMERAGHMPERRTYRPHITLCRLKSPLSGEEKKLLESLKPAGSWRAESFRLYESTLLPTGAVHKVIKIFPLDV